MQTAKAVVGLVTVPVGGATITSLRTCVPHQHAPTAIITAERGTQTAAAPVQDVQTANIAE
ncbi:MAG: hypothetical protein LUQ38_06245 [Methanotrichaceae archaeon]|nr:hypothetical protein [Methanotrichaceae archaeon]MDD1757506.1 hypothetical protein [Methanotrichaceae archaeon]